MRSIAYECEIKKDHLLSVKLPEDIFAGKHQIILIIDEMTNKTVKKQNFPAPVSIKHWPKNLSLSRKDIYVHV